MKYIKTLACAGVLLAAAATTVPAQPNGPGGAGGWGAGHGRRFDPRTVETASGEITAIDLITPTRGGSPGVHLTLETDKGETLAVHLGPRWYIDQQPFKLAKGDQVQVRGSRITFQGDKPTVIAAEVTRNGKTMRLRDDRGVPAWAGWRRAR